MSTTVPTISPWNRGTPRRPNYWLRYSVDGKRYAEATRARNKAELKAAIEALERRFRLGHWQPNTKPQEKGALPFFEYARAVIAKRAARGVKTAAKDESNHVERHLIPLLGPIAMRDLTFVVIRDAFAKLIAKGDLSSRMIRNIHTTLRGVLIEAAEDEIFAFPPPPLTIKRGHLPPIRDARGPQWRQTAHFTRDEVAALIGCVEIETQYRVMYAAYFLTASRFAEVTTILVQDYERNVYPLNRLIVRAVKTPKDKGQQMFRVVPVHDDLRRWLDWYLDHEYEVLHGKLPAPGDLMFPTLSPRRIKRGETAVSHGELYKRWARHHLPAAGLRHRRLHDSRRTWISVARSTTRNRDAVRSISHKVTGDRVMDAYTDWEWSALCAEISAVEWSLPPVPELELDG